jgi:hypothetical protein
MKKTILYTTLIFAFILLAGCSKEEIFLTSEDVISNTLLLKRDGTIYAAIVEDFDKGYYNITELNEFISSEVEAYNQKIGSKEVTIEELNIKDSKAVMILGYTKLEHYSAFNNIPAAYFSADTQNVALELPTQYIDSKSNKTVDRAAAIKSNKNKVLVLYEPYEIIVEGDIKFYSDNVTYVENNKARSKSEDVAVIVYKP